MKQTKKLLALCLCSTVAATSFSTITIEAKTSARTAVVSGVLSNTITTGLSMVQPQKMQAFAVSNDGFIYEVNEESATTITITGYEGNASELVIPDKIDGYTVTKIGEGAFGESQTLKAITLASTIIHIGDRAFKGCTNLLSVNLSSTLSSIGSEAFGECTGLTTIFIPKTLKQFTGLTMGPFSGCTNLKTATIEEGATVICDSLFYGSEIETVNMPDTIKEIQSHAFFNCKNLTSVKLSSNLTDIGKVAFGNCTGLTTIFIPKTLNNYTGLTDGPFRGCTNLKTATIEEGATVICESLFQDSEIETVNMPDTIKEIQENAFYNCKNLTSVKLPSNLTDMGRVAFGNCTGLTSIIIPKTLKNYAGSTYGAFIGCTNLKTATIEEGATVICDRLFYESSVEIVNIPSTIKTVGERVFCKCANLKEVYFSCNAPTIKQNAFKSVTATAYYPVNNSTWTEDVRQNYGGKITWKTWKPAVTPKPTATVTTITNTTVTKVTTTTSNQKVLLRWKKKSNVTGYQIYRKIENGKYKLIKTIKKAGTVKWTDKAVKRGKTYYYKIRAYKKGNKKKTYSKFSSVKKVIVK